MQKSDHQKVDQLAFQLGLNFFRLLIVNFLNQFCSYLFNQRSGVTSTVEDKVIVPLANRRQRNPHSRQLEDIYLSTPALMSTLDGHRDLRLRGAERGFQFHPELVVQRGRERVGEFLHSYKFLSKELQVELDNMETSLNRFGYKLKQFAFHSQLSIFKEWEFH